MYTVVSDMRTVYVYCVVVVLAGVVRVFVFVYFVGCGGIIATVVLTVVVAVGVVGVCCCYYHGC